MIIFVIFFIIIIFIVVGMLSKVLINEKYRTKENDYVVLQDRDIQTSQEFLPFKNIENDVIDLGNFRYRKIIECTSINYDLKTEQEKEIIEASFARFLNSFQFPIAIFIQTRKIELSSYLLNLNASIDDTIETFPQLKEYGDIFKEDMKHLPDITGNSKQKKKYIIVGYDNAAYLENLDDNEKKEEGIKELNLRVSTIIDNLVGIGLNTNVLNTYGLLELMYYTYHKDDFGNFENLLTDDFTELLVGLGTEKDENGKVNKWIINKNPLSDLDNMNRATGALNISKNIINNEIVNSHHINEDTKEIYEALLDGIDEMIEELKRVTGDKNNV